MLVYIGSLTDAADDNEYDCPLAYIVTRQPIHC